MSVHAAVGVALCRFLRLTSLVVAVTSLGLPQEVAYIGCTSSPSSLFVRKIVLIRIFKSGAE